MRLQDEKLDDFRQPARAASSHTHRRPAPVGSGCRNCRKGAIPDQAGSHPGNVGSDYNQRFAQADAELADNARHKDKLGYHDIRLGNVPDGRLMKFVRENLPRVLPEARQRFEENRDLLSAFASGGRDYEEFAARIRRRVGGTNEDHDWEE